VPAHGYRQSEALDGQPAEGEDAAPDGVRKQDESGYGEKESGWHDQQPGIFHGFSFRFCASMDGRPVDVPWLRRGLPHKAICGQELPIVKPP
jgi:hypothetical protein